MFLRLMLPAVLVFPVVAASPDRGCEPRPEIRKLLEEVDTAGKLPYADRIATRRNLIEAELSSHPADAYALRRYVQFVRYDLPDEFPVVRDRYRKLAAEHPGDPSALYAAGVALYRHSTPEAIKLLEKAAAIDAAFALPHLQLAQILGSGKFVNKERSRAELGAFFKACPESLDSEAHRLLNEAPVPHLQAQVAKSVRARLERETDATVLKEYAKLWALEFRVRPVREHETIRKQVAGDVARIEKLNPKPDAEWLDFLKGGLKQSGATAAAKLFSSLK